MNKFKICEGSTASWTDQEFTAKDLRSRVEPWLSSLFQSEHLSLLVGSGLTHAVHYLAANKAAVGMSALHLSNYKDKIDDKAKESARKAGRKEGNLEDQLRVANELLRGLEILGDPEADNLRNELNEGMKGFVQSILSSENGIVTANEDKREQAFNTLITFLMSFTSHIEAHEQLNIFTTNYNS